MKTIHRFFTCLAGILVGGAMLSSMTSAQATPPASTAPDLSYSVIARAQANSLTLDQIAEAYALARAAGRTLDSVLSSVEHGNTFAQLAQQRNVPLSQIDNATADRARIAAYLDAAPAAPSSDANTTPASTTPLDSNPPAVSPRSQTITDFLISDGRFKQLTAALKTAGLDGYLRGPGMFTLFAPTDYAFSKLPPDQLSALLKDPAKLSHLLQYHLVGRQMALIDIDSLTDPSVDALERDPLQIAVTNGLITVNGANVTQSNIACSNGTVYAIDTVLTPPDNDYQASPRR